MRIFKILFLFLFVGILLFSCKEEKKIVDLILINGKINTVDDSMKVVESLVIINGKIFDLGSDEYILSAYKSENIIDLKGKFVYPGFIDAHCHFYGYAINKEMYCDLRGSLSLEEVIVRLKNFEKQHPENPWILGRGWDQNLWKNKQLPDNFLLNKEFPTKPLVITRIDGHAVLANDSALAVAGLSDQTDLMGIKILIKQKKLSGLLIENAADSMRKSIPDFPDNVIRKAILHAQHDCFSVGLTSVQDAGLDKKEIQLLIEMQKMDALKINIYSMLNPTDENIETYLKKGPYKTDRFHIQCLKLYADGALGSRGACLLQPYSDDTSHGLFLYTQEQFDYFLKLAFENNFQVATHAIGDSAVRFVLNSYSVFLKGKNDKRWRIEHSQVVNMNDFAKYAENNIIPVVNTTHATSDMLWAGNRLGEKRVMNAYAYKQLFEQNNWIANGSDFPVEEINPLFGFYSAVYRQPINKQNIKQFQPENALTKIQALRAMTIWAAKAAFEEKYKGSLEKGKYADFVVMDYDLLSTQQKDFSTIKIVSTFIQGEQVY